MLFASSNIHHLLNVRVPEGISHSDFYLRIILEIVLWSVSCHSPCYFQRIRWTGPIICADVVHASVASATSNEAMKGKSCHVHLAPLPFNTFTELLDRNHPEFRVLERHCDCWWCFDAAVLWRVVVDMKENKTYKRKELSWQICRWAQRMVQPSSHASRSTCMPWDAWIYTNHLQAHVWRQRQSSRLSYAFTLNPLVDTLYLRHGLD